VLNPSIIKGFPLLLAEDGSGQFLIAVGLTDELGGGNTDYLVGIGSETDDLDKSKSCPLQRFLKFNDPTDWQWKVEKLYG